MYVDNKSIGYNCEELGQEFEKFVVMAMKPGANLDSLPILDNPDNFDVHAYAAFILELSYVATTYHSSTLLRDTLLVHFQSNACSSLVCQIFGFTMYLVSQIASLPRVEISYALIC